MRQGAVAREFCELLRALLLLVGSAIFAARGTAADGMPEPICWRQLSFSIPFKIAPVEAADQQPAEVRLYVSANQGVQWDLAKRVSPQEHTFTFSAQHDGEYWFQIRTADKQGRITPEVGGTPELRVIVDTMKPRLDLTASRGEAGEVKASWQAVDPLLNPDSFKLEYQTSSDAWRPVAVDRQPAGQNRSTSTGTLTWFPTDAPAGSVAVRAEVSDQAGNVTQSQAQANLPGVGSRPDLTASNHGAAQQPPAERNWISTPSANWGASPVPPSNNVAQSKSMSGPSSFTGRNATPPPQRQLAGDPGATLWPANNATDQPLGRNPIPSDDTAGPVLNAADTRGVADRSRFASSQPSYSGSQSPYSGNTDRYGDIASRTVENVNPPIQRQMPPDSGFGRVPDNGFAKNDRSPNTRNSDFNPSSSAPLSIPASSGPADSAVGRGGMSGSASANGMLPPGERPLMVNSRSFDLEYDVEGVGPSGIARVELWGTRDGGRSWSSYGIDNDNRSPILRQC